MNTNPEQDALRSRWTLEGRIPLSGVAEGAVWRRARSVETGEQVVLFIVRGETALEAADAVRRAYLVEDPHLVPVQDIVVFDDPRETDGPSADGEETGPITVVEYPMPTAPPLAALLAKGPLHPETARAVIGEAATGLETARRRGVRHQFVDSNRVFVDTRSGAVTVLGVGVEAATHSGLDRSRETASFQDTAALVALLYRALTGRSPQHDETGTVPRPSAVVDAEIPQDLDLLCDLVLNESEEVIPETTRALIEALEPWQSIPVTLEAYRRGSAAPAAAAAPAATPAPRAGEAGSTAVDDAETVVRPAPQTSARASESEPEGDVADTIARPAASLTGAAGAAGVVGAAGAVGAAGIVASTSSDDPAQSSSAQPSAEQPADQPSSAQTPAGRSVSGPETPGPAVSDAAAPAPAQAPDEVEVEAQAEAAARAEEERTAGAREEAEAARRTSAEARTLVDDLQLTQKRDTTAFPGHLDITLPRAPRTESGTGAHGAATTAGAAGTAAAGGAAVAGGTAAAAGVSAAPPAASSGTQWVQHTSSGAARADAPLAPEGGPPAAESPATPPAGAQVTGSTPDFSAPTPAGNLGAESAPAAPARPSGPIVVHGRDRSLLDEETQVMDVSATRSSLLRDVVGVAVDADDPDTFALGPRDQEKRSLQSQWILIGGAILVMVALVFALTTVTRGVRDVLADPLATGEPTVSATPTEEEKTDEAPVEPTPTEEEPTLPAPELTGVELFAPNSDREPDNADQQDRITDGDPATYWSSKHYGSPDFGGLKEGLGLTLTLSEQSELKLVTVSTALNNGGTIELRAVNDDGSLGEVLATGESVADGEVLLEPEEPVETDKVALWIPELPADSKESGRFRIRIAEVAVE